MNDNISDILYLMKAYKQKVDEVDHLKMQIESLQSRLYIAQQTIDKLELENKSEE